MVRLNTLNLCLLVLKHQIDMNSFGEKNCRSI